MVGIGEGYLGQSVELGSVCEALLRGVFIPFGAEGTMEGVLHDDTWRCRTSFRD